MLNSLHSSALVIKIPPKNEIEKKPRKIIVSGRYCNDAVVKASQRVVTIFFLLLFAWEKKMFSNVFKTPLIMRQQQDFNDDVAPPSEVPC